MTFQEWYAAFAARHHQRSVLRQRHGQEFINELHAAGKHTQANSLIYSKSDPFYTDEVSEDNYAFLSRVWDWPQG